MATTPLTGAGSLGFGGGNAPSGAAGILYSINIANLIR